MAECGPIDFSCKTSEALGGVTEGFTNDAKKIAETMVEATFSGWLTLPTPLISETFGAVGFLRSNLVWVVAILMAFGVIGFGLSLIFKPKADTIRNGGAWMLRTIVVIGGSVTIGSALIQTADGYSAWIIDQALQGDKLGTTVLNTLMLTGPAGFIGALLFGLIAICFSIIQGLLLVARNVMLPLLVKVAPVVAAISQSEMGKAWWSKYISWFLAFLLYKPVAATIYAVGFWLLGEGNILGSLTLGEGIIRGMNFMGGLALMCLSLFAFGALMNVIAPVTGKLTGGMAGAAVVGASAASLAASGAINTGTSTPQIGAAPTSITPTNAAAGAPGAPGAAAAGAVPASGAVGAAGAAGPAGAGVKIAADAAAGAQQGLSKSINNEENEK